MNIPAFVIRYYISLGLCILGLLIPFLVVFYLKLRYLPTIYVPPINIIIHQWLPFVVLLWLLAVYIHPNSKIQLIGWVLFIIGILLSVISYFLIGLANQSSMFYTTQHWISYSLHLLGFSIPFIVNFYIKSKYSSKIDIGAIGYQWIPVTSILWLIGAYVYPESRVNLLGWVLFGFGMTLSAIWYGLTRIYR